MSASHDKTVKVWDLQTHKVLKNWDYHQDSVHSLYVNENFTKVLTGSRIGEVYLTDLSTGCFCKIDNVGEAVTSLAMNKELDILCTTSQSKIYEYVS